MLWVAESSFGFAYASGSRHWAASKYHQTRTPDIMDHELYGDMLFRVTDNKGWYLEAMAQGSKTRPAFEGTTVVVV